MGGNPEELRTEDVLSGVYDVLNKKGVKYPDTNSEFMPRGLERPVSFQVRTFFIDRGYILADENGKKTDAEEETTAFGLLLEQNLKPTSLPWVRLFRRLHRPPARWVGVAHFPEAEDDDWLIRIFGKQNIAPLANLAADMSVEFARKVIPRFSSEVEKRERGWINWVA